ncbi:MAG: hypothetical protein U0793_20580 [Gemmataceae bacterium]
MSTAKAPKPTASSTRPLLPPPETFWKKYSPRHEAPLSSAISIFLHAVVIGLILLLGYLAQLRWNDPNERPPENDVVELGPGAGGPEGGSGPSGLPGDGKPIEVNVGSPGAIEEIYGQKFVPESAAPEIAPPELDPAALKPDPDPTAKDVFDELKKTSKEPPEPKKMTTPATIAKSPGPRTKDKGGIGGTKGGVGGSDGGGYGPGPGKGSKWGPGGPGGGGRPMTRAEFLAQRWNFDLSGPPKVHLDKLTKIGFIVGLEGADGRFYTIDTAAKPLQPRLDTQEKYKDAVKWFNRHPPSVEGVTKEMGIGFPVKHIVLILPREREKKLIEEELRYAKSKGVAVKSFDYIWFDFQVRDGQYEPKALRVGKGNPFAAAG